MSVLLLNMEFVCGKKSLFFYIRNKEFFRGFFRFFLVEIIFMTNLFSLTYELEFAQNL